MRKDTITRIESVNELTAREKINLSTTDDAVKIKTVVNTENSLNITLKAFCIMNCEYDAENEIEPHGLIVLMDVDGVKYTSSSPFLISSIEELYDKLVEYDSSIFDDAIKIIAREGSNNGSFYKAVLA